MNLNRNTTHLGLLHTKKYLTNYIKGYTNSTRVLLCYTRSSTVFSLLLGIAEQSQALSAATDANTEEKRLLSRLLMKTKKAQTNASDLQRYCIQ